MPRRDSSGSADHPAPSFAPDEAWTVPDELQAKPLDGALRALGGGAWSEARRAIATGKIRVNGEVVTEGTRKVRAGDRVERFLRAPRPEVARAKAVEADLFAYLDPQVVVVRKPSGVSTVPYGDEEGDERGATLDAITRDVLARKDAIRGRAPLGVVQRLDKGTSGLLVFSRTFAAKKHLGAQLRNHTMHRLYWAIAHGDVRAQTFSTHLVSDRGDGLRGSSNWRRPGNTPRDRMRAGMAGVRRDGQLAVTHVEPIESLNGATLVACRLETGRTHQIRIHLAEVGHPLVGERVYVRDFSGVMIPAARAMLHAIELGFDHPVDDRPMLFRDPPPSDFEETLARLRSGRPAR